MNLRNTNKGLKQYELSRERKDLLSQLEGTLSMATRKGVQDALRLPDRIRTRYIQENANYRAAIKQLLEQQLATENQTDDEDVRNVMQEIVDGISEFERINAKIESLNDNPSNSDENDDQDSDRDEIDAA